MSDILNVVHKTATGLHKSGAINKTTMRKFDAVCLTEMHEFTPTQVKALREKSGLSQPVFARYLNVSDQLVKKMGTGRKHSPRPSVKDACAG